MYKLSKEKIYSILSEYPHIHKVDSHMYYCKNNYNKILHITLNHNVPYSADNSENIDSLVEEIFSNCHRLSYLENGLSHSANGPAVINFHMGIILWCYLGRTVYSKEKWFEKLTSEEKQNFMWNFDEY